MIITFLILSAKLHLTYSKQDKRPNEPKQRAFWVTDHILHGYVIFVVCKSEPDFVLLGYMQPQFYQSSTSALSVWRSLTETDEGVFDHVALQFTGSLASLTLSRRLMTHMHKTQFRRHQAAPMFAQNHYSNNTQAPICGPNVKSLYPKHEVTSPDAANALHCGCSDKYMSYHPNYKRGLSLSVGADEGPITVVMSRLSQISPWT